jgi:uncharacterized protein (TIGR03083 family)
MAEFTLARHDCLFLDAASRLADDDWARPSLCTGWTNQDVLAHLLLGFELPLAKLIATMARHRASFDAANDQLTRARATQGAPRELLDDFARYRRKPRRLGRVVLPTRFMLGDHVVHHLDIVLALGIEPAIPEDAARAVLTTETRIPNPLVPARRIAAGLTLTATDIDWRRVVGDGPEVEGHAAHLISVLAGRPHAVAHLTGEGVHVLHQRIARS